MSKCPNCGAEIQFKAKTQLVHCEYCGSDFKPSELRQAAKKAKEVKKDEFEGKAYSCSQCGARLLTFDETAVTFCSYCGSQAMIEEKMIKQTKPDFIIPFKVSQEECIHNYKKAISNFLFSPAYMKDDFVVKKFRGIYMPYGIYKLSFSGDCVNKGQKYHHRSGDYVIYNDYALHADVNACYDGISFDLLSKFYDEYSQSIPFDHKGAVEFNTNFLPGFYADSKDVELDTYSNDAITIGMNDTTRFLKKKWIYKRYNCMFPTVKLRVENEKTAMFPVYFLAIRDKEDKHIHYAIINGQTGKVAADMPIDYKKYFVFSIFMAVPIFFIINLIPIVLPKTIDMFAIAMTIIAFIIYLKQLSACNEREGRYSDKGYSSLFVELDSKGRRIRRKRVNKYKISNSFIVKQLFAFLIPLFILLIKPVNDAYYYASALIGLCFILWSFHDLVKIHNQLVSRPIPQLEKRGGDEHE